MAMGRVWAALGGGLVLALAACGEAPGKTDVAAEAATGPGAATPEAMGIELPADMAAQVAEAQKIADAAMAGQGASGGLSNAKVVHYTVTGVLADKHVQIPAADADQYADVTDKLTIELDWDVAKAEMIGAAKITNAKAEVTNLSGMGDNCPTGEMKGPYEHFDGVEVRAIGGGTLEVVGVRKHPDTEVAESCGAGRKLYKAADRPVSTMIAPPDPKMIEMLRYAPTANIKLGPDGASVEMKPLNENWTWTYKPTVK